MTSSLRYLLARSFVNSLLSRLRRLRKPKYLFGAVIGAAYFYFYFYRFLFRGGSPVDASRPALIPDAFWPEVGATILLLATLVFSWLPHIVLRLLHSRLNARHIPCLHTRRRTLPRLCVQRKIPIQIRNLAISPQQRIQKHLPPAIQVLHFLPRRRHLGGSPPR